MGRAFEHSEQHGNYSVTQTVFIVVSLLFGRKTQAFFFSPPSFFFVLTADREDGEIQLEGEGEESDEQDEEVENEGESLYNESKYYLAMKLAHKCFLYKTGLDTKTQRILVSFSIKGVAYIFQSGWRATSCHTQSTYLTVVCTSRSDNFGLHMSHLKFTLRERGLKNFPAPAATTSITLR